MKRQLNKKEKALAMKGLNAREVSVKWLKYQIKYHDLMLDEGIEVNYKKTLSDFKDKKKEFEGELATCLETITILTKQIREGVDIIKENVEDAKEDVE